MQLCVTWINDLDVPRRGHCTHWSLVTRQLRECSPLRRTPPVPGKMWQDKGSSKSGKGAEGKGSTQKSTVRIAVISIWADGFKMFQDMCLVWNLCGFSSSISNINSNQPMDPNGQMADWRTPKKRMDFPRLSLHRGVMMHCLKHLPADDFASELPRILGASVDVYSSWKPSFAHMIRMGSPKNDRFPLGWRTSQFLFFWGPLGTAWLVCGFQIRHRTISITNETNDNCINSTGWHDWIMYESSSLISSYNVMIDFTDNYPIHRLINEIIIVAIGVIPTYLGSSWLIPTHTGWAYETTRNTIKHRNKMKQHETTYSMSYQ